MDTDGYIVSDSEELGDDDDDITVLYDPTRALSDPIDDKNDESQISGLDNRSDKSLGTNIEKSLEDKKHNDNTIVSRGKWSLRKRTAIQKLPYSLERIKHRQQLEGFDISNFDSVSNNVDLPIAHKSFNETQLSATNKANLTENDDNPYLGEINDDSDFSDNSSEIEGNVDNDVEEEDIIFRGRVINMKTGYRGILPKSAWEKALSKTNKAKAYIRNKRKPIEYHKGLAIKKRAIRSDINQDNELLSELVVEDNGEYDQIEGDQEFYLRKNVPTPDIRRLNDIDRYYSEKYSTIDYLSDDEERSNLENRNEPKEYKSNDSYIATPKDTEIINIDSDGFVSDIDVELLTDDDGDFNHDELNVNRISKEINNGIIDSMLSKQSRKVSYSSKNKSKRRRNFLGRSVINGSKQKLKKPQIVKRVIAGHIYRYRDKTNPKRRDIVEKDQKVSKSAAYSSNAPQHDENNIKKVAKKVAKPNKPVPSFLTVVEALGNKYASVSNKTAVPSTSLDVNEYGPNNSDASLPILDILLENKLFEPPNTIKIKLSGKTYLLSRYNMDEIPTTLMEMFDMIINQGAGDIELIECNKLLSEFIVHLNNISLLNIVEIFHKQFRSRVYSTRSKSKPIHFYQLSICQLYLLEIAKYSNTPNVTRFKIIERILKNIVSFFTLLSKCYSVVKKGDMELLYESYNVLATVVDILNLKQDIWDQFSSTKFRPRILLIICAIFPTEVSNWDALFVRSEYVELIDAFQLVKYCSKVCKWPVSESLILSLNDIFKRRRFLDFSEELTNTEKNYVIRAPSSKLPVGTLFNKYLTLLRSLDVTVAMSEKIIPISEISMVDDDSIIINRLNLLIVLANNINFNLDRRLGNLIKSLIGDKSTEKCKFIVTKKRISGLFNSVLAFLKINAKKGHPFRLKHIISKAHQFLIADDPSQEDVWLAFLKSLERHFNDIQKSRSLVLKDLYNPLAHSVSSESSEEGGLIIMNLFVNNLKLVKKSWLQSNILPLVKSKAEISIDWVNYYCLIGKFLVSNKVMTWWSFQMYQGLKGKDDIQICFNTKLIEFCDSNSFNVIKKSLFEFATMLFFGTNNVLFRKYIVNLLKRESGIVFNAFLNGYHNNIFVRIKIYFQALKKLHYSEQMIILIDQIEKLFSEGSIPKELTLKIVQYLNKQYVDDIKSCHSFVMLKRKLNISDVETERSLFRDTLKSYSKIEDQSFFIERNLIESLSDPEEIQGMIEKLKPLFLLTLPFSPFKLFVGLIQLNMNFDNYQLLNLKNTLVTILLKIINDVLKDMFYQVDKLELSELLNLSSSLVNKYESKSSRLPETASLYGEMLKLLVCLLKITQGLPEWKKCSEICRAYCYGMVNFSHYDVDSTLQRKVLELLIKQDETVKEFKFETPNHCMIGELLSEMVNLFDNEDIFL